MGIRFWNLRRQEERENFFALMYASDAHAATYTCNYSIVMLTRCPKRILQKSSRKGGRRRKLNQTYFQVPCGLHWLGSIYYLGCSQGVLRNGKN